MYSPCYCLLSGPFVKIFVKVNAKQICLWEQNKVTWIKLPYIYQENQTKCLSFGMKNKDRKTLFVLQCFLVNIVVDISVLSTHKKSALHQGNCTAGDSVSYWNAFLVSKLCSLSGQLSSQVFIFVTNSFFILLKSFKFHNFPVNCHQQLPPFR